MTDHVVLRVVLLLTTMRPFPGRLCKANGTATADWSFYIGQDQACRQSSTSTETWLNIYTNYNHHRAQRVCSTNQLLY